MRLHSWDHLLIVAVTALCVMFQGSVLADASNLETQTITLASLAGTSSPPPAVPSPSKGSLPILTIVRPITIAMFLIFIGVTLMVVYWAARRTKTSADFYVAGASITGVQNGWALAGDYMSAASFLGIAGLISLYGYDGFLYSVGWLVAYVTLLLIVAEPCRNSGRYTIGDILSFRSFPIPVRAMAAVSTVTVSTFYLIAQMVGAGKLMELLLGVPFRISIILVGSIMIIYVVFGGMIATTWVQIIKAFLIMTGGLALSILVAAHAGFSPLQFFADISNNSGIKDWVQFTLLNHPVAQQGIDYGQRFLEPGLFLKNPLDQVSLGMALVFGTAGMPHILMRFFTVPTAKEARKSVIVAMFVIGSFYLLTTLLGFGAAIHVGPQTIFATDPGGNLATLLLAQALGNQIAPIVGDTLLAFLCSVAFATILAVVSGLVLAASAAIAHDVYVSLIKKGHASQKQQIIAARVTSFAVGAAAIVVGMAAENQNVAQLVALAFAVAASGNLPVVILSLFWRKFNTAGIVAGLVIGTAVCLVLVLVSPNMHYPKQDADEAFKVIKGLELKQSGGATLTPKEQATLSKARIDYERHKDGLSLIGLDKPLFPLKNPGIVSIPLGFLAAIMVAFAFPSGGEEQRYDQLHVQQLTGVRVRSVWD